MEARATEDLLGLLLGRDAAASRRALPTNDRGWEALDARVHDLRAEGLLHVALRRASLTEAAPSILRDRWRAAHAATTAQNLQLLEEAKRAMAALDAAGVRVAPMKGVALFQEGVVKDLGTRPTTDIDLATRRADRTKALGVLEALGFRPSEREVSFKHLTPMRKGDLAIELHEIAYWSGADRRVFGVDHLAAPDRAVRLGRLWALQVHHLVLGSPPDAALLVRTLADLAGFAELAKEEPGLPGAAREALVEAGLLEEGAALDAMLSRWCGSGRGPLLEPPGLAVDDGLARTLLAPLAAEFSPDPRQKALAHLLATARRQPLEILARTAAVLLFPPRQAIADGLGVEVGSPKVWLARARRPLELGVRVLRTLPKVLRGWTGR